MPWILDGSPGMSTSGNNIVRIGSSNTWRKAAYALWADDEPVKSGEFYETVKFGDFTDGAWVGVTSKERLGNGDEAQKLFYGGYLYDSECCSTVREFGPEIVTNDTVGLLVSFISDQKLQIFIYLNERPLGLAFVVSASLFPNGVYPAVKFNRNGGSATIRKEATIPKDRTRQTPTYYGIEGRWIAEAGSIKIDGQAPSTLLLPKIRFYDRDGNKYKVFLKVVNDIGLSIEKTENSWKMIGGGYQTFIGSSVEHMRLEGAMKKLCFTPDSVSVQTFGVRMIVTKDNSTVTFARDDNTPPPYTGTLFRFPNSQNLAARNKSMAMDWS